MTLLREYRAFVMDNKRQGNMGIPTVEDIVLKALSATSLTKKEDLTRIVENKVKSFIDSNTSDDSVSQAISACLAKPKEKKVDNPSRGMWKLI